MTKTIFALVVLAVVVASLAGGAAYILEQRKLQEVGRTIALAEDKLNSGSIDQAIDMLRRAQAERKVDRTTYLLGKALAKQGKHEEASNYYQTLLRDFPKSNFTADATLELARHELNFKRDKVAATTHLADILRYWPKSDAADFALVMLAEISLAENDEKQARSNLEIVMRKKDSPARSDAEFLMGDFNMQRLKSPEAAPGDELYTIKQGDTLWVMERKLKVPLDLLVGINGLDNPQALKVGKQIRVPNIDISIVVNKVDRTLTLRNGGEFLKKYRVGIHQDPTMVPTGNFTIRKKHAKGLDYVNTETRETIKAGQPDNPYGKRFLEIRERVGIHGTDDEERVGKPVSKGFVVMTNEDIDEVYALVDVKTPVTIIGNANQEKTTGK